VDAAEYGVRVRPSRPIAQPSDNLPRPRPAASLEDSAEWKQISSAWASAEKLLASKWTGPSAVAPNQQPKKGVLDGIETARKNTDALAGAGLLSAGEAEMLKQGLRDLSARVYDWMPTERICCYEVAVLSPKKFDSERAAAKALTARLPLLEKLAAQKKLQPAVVATALAQFETLVSQAQPPVLSDGNLVGMPEDERVKIVKTRDAAKAAAERLRTMVDEAARQASDQLKAKAKAASRPTPELAARVASCLKDLGSDEWAKREAASKELVKIGPPALAALRAAAAGTDSEVAGRAKAAVAAIEEEFPWSRVDPAPASGDGGATPGADSGSRSR
jgi:hypothetical protein